jgi:hypothetical protein
MAVSIGIIVSIPVGNALHREGIQQGADIGFLFCGLGTGHGDKHRTSHQKHRKAHGYKALEQKNQLLVNIFRGQNPFFRLPARQNQ